MPVCFFLLWRKKHPDVGQFMFFLYGGNRCAVGAIPVMTFRIRDDVQTLMENLPRPCAPKST
jgi:hypothetical protein